MPLPAYDPSLDPLRLPVRVVDFVCTCRRPLCLPRVAGKTPGTLLNGRFRQILHELDPEAAAGLFEVGLPWEPGRSLPPLVLLSAPALWQHRPLRAFTLQVKLVGRLALSFQDSIWSALGQLARTGLAVPDAGNVVFELDLDRGRPRAEGTLLDIADAGPSPRELLLELVTPIQIAERVLLDDGQVRRLFQAGGELDLGTLLGNLAYDLCCLDLAERGQHHDAKALANRARDAAMQSTRGITIERERLWPEDYDTRPSATQRGRYELRGFAGQAVLGGELEAALPWLQGIACWRGAQKASKGFGQVELWRRHERA